MFTVSLWKNGKRVKIFGGDQIKHFNMRRPRVSELLESLFSRLLSLSLSLFLTQSVCMDLDDGEWIRFEKKVNRMKQSELKMMMKMVVVLVVVVMALAARRTETFYYMFDNIYFAQENSLCPSTECARYSIA